MIVVTKVLMLICTEHFDSALFLSDRTLLLGSEIILTGHAPVLDRSPLFPQLLRSQIPSGGQVGPPLP